MKHRGHVGLPRNWRVFTAAGLTTLGLAYGAGPAALGDWWTLPRAKPAATKAASVKPASTSNGFSATIERLMTDARLYADKGELDKAVQLAERAAKISEASSQLLGPASEYSPEQTTRFASELRARRDAVVKRSIPAPSTPRIAAVEPRSNPTATRAPEIASSTERPQPLERLVVERALAERTVAAQPAELTDGPPVDKLAWDEELPPTPAPETAPETKPIKFRRSVLSRSSQPFDEETDESPPIADRAAGPSTADPVLDELLDSEFTADWPATSEPAVPSTATARAETSFDEPVSFNEPVASPSADDLPSPEGGIQPVAAEAPSNDSPALPAAAPRKPSWEDDAFAEELLLSKPSTPKPAGTATKPAAPAAPATKHAAPPFPDDEFPVQRVVQLRRRLETAASLNPGSAYTVPASPVTEPARGVGPAPSDDDVFELPVLSDDSISGDAASNDPDEDAVDWSFPSDVTDHRPSQTPIAPEAASTERPVVRLREHRVLPEHVRAALLKAAALPAPAARRHIVGYSEPMLWQSVEEHDPVAPALSLANGIGDGKNGSRSLSGASLPPDLRDPSSPSAAPDDETSRGSQRVIPTVTVEQTGFRSSKFPLGSIELPESNGPTLSPQDVPSEPSPTVTAAIGGTRTRTNQFSESGIESGRSAKRPASAHSSRPGSKSESDHEVSHRSFALIEPLAAALNLPIATTASLLGGAGLALLGLGLLLVRAAIRWRHS